MGILEEIVENKRREVSDARELSPIKLLEQSIHFSTPCVSMRSYLSRTDLMGIIAEIKRKSPSKGVINSHISVEQLSVGYMQAGASALSILTDRKYFGGGAEDLKIARKFNFCPILRKDFIVDPYQVIEAKALGADVVLLIAAAITPQQVRSLSKLAHSLGMEVLLEVHSEAELQSHLGQAHLGNDIDLVGVNNRDLSDFSVDFKRALDLASKIPSSFTKIAESGISDSDVVVQLKQAGFQGFLIGEHFMQHSKPEVACRRFINRVEESVRNVA